MGEQAPYFKATEARSLVQVVQWEQQPQTRLNRTELLAQIAIPGGIHSCFVTTALNGGIVTGKLTHDEAARVQEIVTSDAYRDRWGEREIRGQTILTWQRDIAAETRQIIGREFPFRFIDPTWCGFSSNTLQPFLRERLAQGYALSWGDEIHQRLAVGASMDGTATEIVDPYSPLTEQTASIAAIAEWHRPTLPIAIIGHYAVLSEQEIVRQFE